MRSDGGDGRRTRKISVDDGNGATAILPSPERTRRVDLGDRLEEGTAPAEPAAEATVRVRVSPPQPGLTRRELWFLVAAGAAAVVIAAGAYWLGWLHGTAG